MGGKANSLGVWHYSREPKTQFCRGFALNHAQLLETGKVAVDYLSRKSIQKKEAGK